MKLVQTKYGSMQVIDSDRVVSHALSMYGEWAMDEIKLLEQLISPGMSVLDVGAYIGTHSLAFSHFVGDKGQVHSFEPRKEICEVLRHNLLLNGCKNVHVSEIGLSDEEGELQLPVINLNEPENFGGLALVGQGSLHENDTYPVRISTIDSLNIEKIDVIKLDVEEMERKVLDGAKKTIAATRPLIFCECNSLQAGADILEFSKNSEFQVFGFLAAAYNENNFNSIKENIFGRAKELGLLLIPKEKLSRTLEKISAFSLLPINNLEDLVLPLLHKPQYPYEVLSKTAPCGMLGLGYPSPGQEEKAQELSQLTNALDAVSTENQKKSEAVVMLQSGLMSAKNQLAALENSLSLAQQEILSRNSQINDLLKTVGTLEGAISDLNSNLANKDSQLGESKLQILERDKYINQLVRSKSWILTKPIRWTGRIMRGDMQAALDPIRRRLLPNTTAVDTPSAAQPVPAEATDVLTREPIQRVHPIAVILPVYRGVEMTKRCILSAMAGMLAVPGSRMIVLNDGSPDEGMQAMLEEMEASYPEVITVLENPNNLGFVRTVNRGFASCEKSDAVLLNSDVVVPENWLQRLSDEAYSRSDIGTVTPFSNNATICSFPYFLQENTQAFNLDVNQIDGVFKRGILPCVEAPTGVGFCMYIRRSCLEQVGYLNEEKFGRGYGEENDLCQRAKKSGWRNVITPNLYAYHEGGVSFSAEKHALVDRAMRVLNELHPNYHADVQHFIKEDPLRLARVGRYVQLLSSLPISKVLHISHALGGGVTQHVNELAKYFGNDVASIIMQPHGKEGQVAIRLSTDPYTDKLILNVKSSYEDVVRLLQDIGISTIHFHHFLDLPEPLLYLHEKLQVPLIVTVHDFYLLNANPTLTGEDGKYRGPQLGGQNNPLYPLPKGKSVQEWQSMYRPFLEQADYVIYPSNSTKEIFETIYRPRNPVVAYHIEPSLNVSNVPHNLVKKAVYTVGVIGAIGREKGADLLEKLAEKSEEAGLPISFKLIGYAYRPLKKVETTGPYELGMLREMIGQANLDIIFFPAQWPETYSYTLSYALDARLPIIAPNVGAFPERLSGRSNTLLFNHLDSPDSLVEALALFVRKLETGISVTAPVVYDINPESSEFYENSYKRLIGERVRNVSAQNSLPYLLEPANILSGMKNSGGGWREQLLGVLWKIYMNPSMRWVGHAIPFEMRRAVKRSLSRNSIHNMKNGQ